jgi:hypothetical protein
MLLQEGGATWELGLREFMNANGPLYPAARY